jgi:hypothetical protein
MLYQCKCLALTRGLGVRVQDFSFKGITFYNRPAITNRAHKTDYCCDNSGMDRSEKFRTKIGFNLQGLKN